jgi:uncharacterized protein (UPF0333 family)
LKGNGQASLEALLVLAAVLGLFGIFVTAFQGITDKSVLAAEKSEAIAEAKKCAAVIDAVFSNSGGKPKTILENCFPKGPHEILVKGFAGEKTAFTIAETIRLVPYGNELVLEVITPEHYK